MAFKFLQEKVASKQLLKKFETTCQTRLTLDEDELVENILECFGAASIIAEERVQSSINFNGKVNFSVIFENKAKVLSSLSGDIDFSDKTSVSEAEWTYSNAKVVGIRAVKESPSSIEVNVVVEVSFYGIKKEEIKPLEVNNENCFEKKKEIVISELTSAVSDTFSVSDDFEFGEAMTKFVAVYPSIVLSKIIPEENYVVLEGEFTREFICLCGEHVRRYIKTYDFSEEISLLGCKKDSLVDLTIKMQSFDNNYEIISEQNKTIIHSATTVKVNVFGFTNKVIETVADVFSKESNLLLSTECVENRKFVSQNLYSEKINLVFDSSKLKRIDEIIAIVNSCVVVNKTIVEDEMINISADISADVIYKNYESDSLTAIKISIPFNYSQKIINADQVDASVEARCASFKNKPGKEISLTYDIDVNAELYKSNFDCFISNIEEQPIENKDNSAITIYMTTKNQTLFDVAKELVVSPEEILLQNKDVSEDNMPEKIIIYRKQ